MVLTFALAALHRTQIQLHMKQTALASFTMGKNLFSRAFCGFVRFLCKLVVTS